MNEPNWNKAPEMAQYWAPASNKYMEGWYRADEDGSWAFSISNHRHGAEWWRLDCPPNKNRQRQMVRRP